MHIKEFDKKYLCECRPSMFFKSCFTDCDCLVHSFTTKELENERFFEPRGPYRNIINIFEEWPEGIHKIILLFCDLSNFTIYQIFTALQMRISLDVNLISVQINNFEDLLRNDSISFGNICKFLNMNPPLQELQIELADVKKNIFMLPRGLRNNTNLKRIIINTDDLDIQRWVCTEEGGTQFPYKDTETVRMIKEYLSVAVSLVNNTLKSIEITSHNSEPLLLEFQN